MTNEPARGDVYARVTDAIVAAIEAGAHEHRLPWHNSGETLRPTNVETGKPYRGVNVVALWAATTLAGHDTAVWGTYRQWQGAGAQVRKGEKASSVVFWQITEREQPDSETSSGAHDDEAAGRRLLARVYHVFNAAQVEGWTPGLTAVPTPEAERNEHAERFFATPRVVEGGNRAYYQPATDEIRLPPFAMFRDATAYYATLAHEATHWTGHPNRCARDLRNRFGSEAYAVEELIAELGAAFLCADLGLVTMPRPDHAAYIASWLTVLRNDKRAIFTAAARAQTAVDWMNSARIKACSNGERATQSPSLPRATIPRQPARRDLPTLGRPGHPDTH